MPDTQLNGAKCRDEGRRGVVTAVKGEQGQGAVAFNWITNIAISVLFFLQGAKLSRNAVIAGAGHWRLHLLVFICTFGLFPVLGLALKPLLVPMAGAELYAGFLYLCVLPATVQSAIAFTSMARGNIPAAICSAADTTYGLCRLGKTLCKETRVSTEPISSCNVCLLLEGLGKIMS